MHDFPSYWNLMHSKSGRWGKLCQWATGAGSRDPQSTYTTKHVLSCLHVLERKRRMGLHPRATPLAHTICGGTETWPVCTKDPKAAQHSSHWKNWQICQICQCCQCCQMIHFADLNKLHQMDSGYWTCCIKGQNTSLTLAAGCFLLWRRVIAVTAWTDLTNLSALIAVTALSNVSMLLLQCGCHAWFSILLEPNA